MSRLAAPLAMQQGVGRPSKGYHMASGTALGRVREAGEKILCVEIHTFSGRPDGCGGVRERGQSGMKEHAAAAYREGNHVERASGLHCGVAGRHVPDPGNEYPIWAGRDYWVGTGNWGRAGGDCVVSDCVCVVAAGRAVGDLGADGGEYCAGEHVRGDSDCGGYFPHCEEGESAKLPVVDSRKRAAAAEYKARLAFSGVAAGGGDGGGGNSDWRADLGGADAPDCLRRECVLKGRLELGGVLGGYGVACRGGGHEGAAGPA